MYFMCSCVHIQHISSKTNQQLNKMLFILLLLSSSLLSVHFFRHFSENYRNFYSIFGCWRCLRKWRENDTVNGWAPLCTPKRMRMCLFTYMYVLYAMYVLCCVYLCAIMCTHLYVLCMRSLYRFMKYCMYVCCVYLYLIVCYLFVYILCVVCVNLCVDVLYPHVYMCVFRQIYGADVKSFLGGKRKNNREKGWYQQ